MIVEPEPLTTPLEASTVLQVPEPPKKEEILPLENISEFEVSPSPILETPQIIMQ